MDSWMMVVVVVVVVVIVVVVTVVAAVLQHASSMNKSDHTLPYLLRNSSTEYSCSSLGLFCAVARAIA